MSQRVLIVAIVSSIAIGIVAWLELRPAQEVGQDLVEGLEPVAGRQLVLTHCVPCHSTSLVRTYRTSRQGWDEVIDRMQKEEGLWSLTGEDRQAILDYLEATQGPLAEEDLVKATPWAEPLYKPNPIW